MDVNLVAAAGDILAGRAHVIFHVTGTQNAARVDVFESSKDLLGNALGNVGNPIQAATMTHPHHKFSCAETRTGFEKFVHERDERGDAFEGEAFAAEIALLHDLLEYVGADKEIENPLLVFCWCFRFHALIDPAAAFGGIDVVDLDADGGRIDGARFARVFTLNLQFGSRAWSQKTERIEVAFEVAELAEGVEDPLTLQVDIVLRRSFDYGGASGTVGTLGFRGHRNADTRIKDASAGAQDSVLDVHLKEGDSRRRG